MCYMLVVKRWKMGKIYSTYIYMCVLHVLLFVCIRVAWNSLLFTFCLSVCLLACLPACLLVCFCVSLPACCLPACLLSIKYICYSAVAFYQCVDIFGFLPTIMRHICIYWVRVCGVQSKALCSTSSSSECKRVSFLLECVHIYIIRRKSQIVAIAHQNNATQESSKNNHTT